jgi:hypothetical protein
MIGFQLMLARQFRSTWLDRKTSALMAINRAGCSDDDYFKGAKKHVLKNSVSIASNKTNDAKQS